MAITFHIPAPLRPYVDGQSTVQIDSPAANLDVALRALFRACPKIRDRVVDEQGELRVHVKVFVGKEDSLHTGGMKTPVHDGTDISIFPAITGGCNESDDNPQ